MPDIEQTLEAVMLSLHGLAELQDEHLAEISTGKIAQFQDWELQRNLVKERLGQQLTAVHSLPPQAIPVGFKEKILEKFEKVVQKEVTLKSALETLRRELKEKIGHLRKGKTALHGYKVYSGEPAPRYLSSRG